MKKVLGYGGEAPTEGDDDDDEGEVVHRVGNNARPLQLEAVDAQVK